MWFAVHASVKCLPEPRYASWLTISLTDVPPDMRRPSAALLHPPRNSDISKVRIRLLLSRRERGRPRAAAPAHQKVLQNIFSIGRRQFLITDLATERWLTGIGRGWHTDQLVLRTTFRAGELLVGAAPIHDVLVGFAGFQEYLYHVRMSRVG